MSVKYIPCSQSVSSDSQSALLICCLIHQEIKISNDFKVKSTASRENRCMSKICISSTEYNSSKENASNITHVMPEYDTLLRAHLWYLWLTDYALIVVGWSVFMRETSNSWGPLPTTTTTLFMSCKVAGKETTPTEQVIFCTRLLRTSSTRNPYNEYSFGTQKCTHPKEPMYIPFLQTFFSPIFWLCSPQVPDHLPKWIITTRETVELQTKSRSF